MKCFLPRVLVENPPICKLPQLEMEDVFVGKWACQIKFTILWTTILWNMELDIKPLRSNYIKLRFADNKGAGLIYFETSVNHCQVRNV